MIRNQFLLDLSRELIIDNFAGGGGASTGIELVARCQAVVYQCKRAYRRMDLFEIGSVVKTQLIANAAEAAGLTVANA